MSRMLPFWCRKRLRRPPRMALTFLSIDLLSSSLPTARPDTAAGAVSATTCSRATWDTVLYFRNGDGVGDVCNDDACGALQSTASGSVSAGAGLHTLVIDGYSGQSGSDSLQVTRP